MSQMEEYLTVLEHVKKKEDVGVMQSDLIRLLQEKHGLSQWVARERVRTLYKPFMCPDGRVALPMLLKQLTILGNRPQTILRVHNEWKKASDVKVRNLLTELMSTTLPPIQG